MFKYTRASIEVIIDDIQKYAKIFKYSMLVFTSIYFIYALISKTGNFIANSTLASLFVIYTIFEFITIERDIKLVKKIVKRSYNWIKILIKAFTLGAIIYGVYTTTIDSSPLQIILTTLMIISWVIQVLLEIIVEIVENKIDLVVAGWNQDMEDFKKPFTVVNNTFKKITGQEIEPDKEKSRALNYLEKRMAKKKYNK